MNTRAIALALTLLTAWSASPAFAQLVDPDFSHSLGGAALGESAYPQNGTLYETGGTFENEITLTTKTNCAGNSAKRPEGLPEAHSADYYLANAPLLAEKRKAVMVYSISEPVAVNSITVETGYITPRPIAYKIEGYVYDAEKAQWGYVTLKRGNVNAMPPSMTITLKKRVIMRHISIQMSMADYENMVDSFTLKKITGFRFHGIDPDGDGCSLLCDPMPDNKDVDCKNGFPHVGEDGDDLTPCKCFCCFHDKQRTEPQVTVTPKYTRRVSSHSSRSGNGFMYGHPFTTVMDALNMANYRTNDAHITGYDIDSSSTRWGELQWHNDTWTGARADSTTYRVGKSSTNYTNHAGIHAYVNRAVYEFGEVFKEKTGKAYLKFSKFTLPNAAYTVEIRALPTSIFDNWKTPDVPDGSANAHNSNLWRYMVSNQCPVIYAEKLTNIRDRESKTLVVDAEKLNGAIGLVFCLTPVRLDSVSNIQAEWGTLSLILNPINETETELPGGALNDGSDDGRGDTGTDGDFVSIEDDPNIPDDPKDFDDKDPEDDADDDDGRDPEPEDPTAVSNIENPWDWIINHSWSDQDLNFKFTLPFSGIAGLGMEDVTVEVGLIEKLNAIPDFETWRKLWVTALHFYICVSLFHSLAHKIYDPLNG